MKLEVLKLSPAQVAQMTGESIPVIYAAINCGDLPSFLVGRRRFILPADVHKWVAFLKAESDAGRPVTYRSRAALNDPRTRRAG
jgi:predicted DNA-binding transcriptional regulator AlpA